MAKRISPGEEKILPSLSFKINIEVPFSICVTESMKNKLTLDIANINMDFSYACRTALFEDLNIKDKNDFNEYFSECINLAKKKIYKDLKIDRRNSFGSKYMPNRLIKFVDKNKND